MAAAAADEVSAAIAALLGAHAQEYHAAAGQAAAYHQQFVRILSTAAASYADTEATIATAMQGALGVANAHTQVLAGPLLGSAFNAAPVAGLASPVVNGFQMFVSSQLHTVGEALVNSPFGRVLDPIGRIVAGINPGTGQAAGFGSTGANQQQIVIDFVRHGESVANAAHLIDTTPPGTGLTSLGQDQANAIAGVLGGRGPFAGIFASQLIRTQQTAGPLAGLLGMSVQVLPGLNEINAGAFSGLPEISLAGLLYLPAPIAWTLGFPLMPMLAPGATDVNGVVFHDSFTGGLQTMYVNAMANPVEAVDGNVTGVAFSSQFTITVGTLMTVENPAPLLMLTHPLPNTGIVVVQGDPQNGWTLVSWDGIPVAPASLTTKLFIDFRELIMAPQFAAYHIGEALFTGDPTTISNAIRDGIDEVGTAAIQFPLEVTHDLVDTVGAWSLGGLLER